MSLRTFIIIIGILITGTWLLVYLWKYFFQNKQLRSKPNAHGTRRYNDPSSLTTTLKKNMTLHGHKSITRNDSKHKEGKNISAQQRTGSDKNIRFPDRAPHPQSNVPQNQNKTMPHDHSGNADVKDEIHDDEIQDQEARQEDLVVIYVKSRHTGGFDGKSLLNIFANRGVHFGSIDIFHRYILFKNQKRVVYSIANGKKPGHLKPEFLEQNNPDSLTMFLHLARSYNPVKAYSEMIDMAQLISQKLDGELYDVQMSVLTRQTIEHQKEQLTELERHKQISSKQKQQA